MNEEKMGRRIRSSQSGRTQIGFIAGAALILVAMVILLANSSLLTSWGWVNFLSIGIYEFLLVLALGVVVLIYA